MVHFVSNASDELVKLQLFQELVVEELVLNLDRLLGRGEDPSELLVVRDALISRQPDASSSQETAGRQQRELLLGASLEQVFQ